MIQEKAVIFAKELNTENFQVLDGWLRRWKESNDISFTTVSGRSKSITPWLMRGRKRPFQLFCETLTWKTFTTQMNLDFFISAFQIKLTSWSQKSAMGKS